MLKTVTVALLLFISAAPASAASGDAWAEFATEVEESCVEATSETLINGTAVVDPFGSESYGLAIVSGDTRAGTPISIICVFNKQTKVVELGGELEVSISSELKR
jgi:hypothetical protein